MVLSADSVVIISANAFTAIVAAGIMLLALWQAPQKRTNQALSVMMLCLVLFSLLNGFSRVLNAFDNIPVRPFWYVTLGAYGLVIQSNFIFTVIFTKSVETRLGRWGLVVLAISGTFSLAAINFGGAITDIVPGTDGSYTLVFGTAALPSFLSVFIAATLALAVSIQAKGRGQLLRPALIVLLIGLISSYFRRALGPIPLNSIALLVAALIIGRTVFKEQLFSPVSELNAQLQQKNRELNDVTQLKNQFLSNMSYELRTPLSSIIGYSSLVLDGLYGPISDKQRDRLEKVLHNSQHLLTLVSDMLDLSQITSGQMQLHRTRVKVDDVLIAVWGVIEPLAAKKGLSLIRQPEPDLPALMIDEMRLRQVLLNLLSNAVKFTERGGITLRVFKRDPDKIRFEIEDTGIGIPPDQFGVIFEEFRQIDSSSTRQYEGTGLGLAITRRLVALHDGEIGLSSTVGQGSTFYVELPVNSIAPVTTPIIAARPTSTQLNSDDPLNVAGGATAGKHS